MGRHCSTTGGRHQSCVQVKKNFKAVAAMENFLKYLENPFKFCTILNNCDEPLLLTVGADLSKEVALSLTIPTITQITEGSFFGLTEFLPGPLSFQPRRPEPFAASWFPGIYVFPVIPTEKEE